MRLSLIFTVVVFAVPVQAVDKAPRVTYDEHILPLLRDKCIACHNQDKKSGGLILNNYTKVMAGSSSGAVVKPGDPDGSPLYRAIAHKQEPFMPPRSPMLPKDSIDLVQRWIAEGALENSGSKATVPAKPKVDFTLPSVVKGKPDGPPPMPPNTLTLEPVVRSGRANAVTALASSPWAPLVAVGGQKQVLLYHSDTLELLGVLPFPEGVPHVLKFSRNGSLLLAGGGRGGKSGRVVVWSVTKGERLLEVGEESDCVLAADVSPDQTQVALGGPSKVVRIYSTRDGQLQQEIRKHTDWVTSLEYSPDGVLLATGDRNGGLFVWEAYTAREYFALRGHTATITDISWRIDGNVVASGSEDGTVRLWEMENGGQVRGWGAHGGGTLAVRYTRDGRLVSCGRDQLTRVWDGNGGAQRAFDALPDVALRTTFTHDGGRVLAGDWTGQIVVWNTADGKRVGELTPNPPTVADRLDVATKEREAWLKARDNLVAAANASKAALQKASADLAAAQKVVADAMAAAEKARQDVPKALEAVNRAKAAVVDSQANVRAKGVLAQALDEAANKVKAAADKSREDRALAAAAARARELATQAAADVTAAQKALNDATVAQKTAENGLTAAQQAVTATANAAAVAPKQTEPLTLAVKNATAKATADQAAADQANAGLAAAEAAVARWKAALATVRTSAGR